MKKSPVAIILISTVILLSISCSLPTLQSNQPNNDQNQEANINNEEEAENTYTPVELPNTLTPTLTNTIESTITLTATLTHTPTIDPIEATSTQRYIDFSQVIDELNNIGYIDSTRGDFVLLQDFEKSWAQIDWYQWTYTNLEPENFVIRVQAEWESASTTANWNNAGCGFIFGETDANNHHAVFVTMDGYLQTWKVVNGLFYEQQGSFIRYFETPQDSAEIMLVVYNKWLTVYVDGVEYVRYEDSYIQKGNLGLSLLSGTNLDFGTRCKMSNVDYWEFY